MNNKKQIKHPCIGCVYFNACGKTNRTMPCDGRMTRSKRKVAEEQSRRRNKTIIKCRFQNGGNSLYLDNEVWGIIF